MVWQTMAFLQLRRSVGRLVSARRRSGAVSTTAQWLAVDRCAEQLTHHSNSKGNGRGVRVGIMNGHYRMGNKRFLALATRRARAGRDVAAMRSGVGKLAVRNCRGLTLWIACVVAGCAPLAATVASPVPPSSVPSSMFGRVCSPDQARTHIGAFMQAANASDRAALERTLSSAVVWVHEAISQTEVRRAYGRDAAITQLLAHPGEVMALRSLQVNAELSWTGYTGFGADVERTIADHTFMQHGKGELACSGPFEGIVVWSFGVD